MPPSLQNLAPSVNSCGYVDFAAPLRHISLRFGELGARRGRSRGASAEGSGTSAMETEDFSLEDFGLAGVAVDGL